MDAANMTLNHSSIFQNGNQTWSNTYNDTDVGLASTVDDALGEEAKLFLPWNNPDNLMSRETRELAQTIAYCGIMPVIMIVGIPGNILNIVIFLKHGLSDRVNTLLLSIAVADLFNLVLLYSRKVACLVSLADRILAQNWETVLFPQVVFLNIVFYSVSNFLVAVLSVERCIAITVPLKASSLLKTKNLVIVIAVVYLFFLVVYFPSLFQYKIRWVKDPETNRNLAYLTSTQFYKDHKELGDIMNMLRGQILFIGVRLFNLILVIGCNLVVIVMLHRAQHMRKMVATSLATLSKEDSEKASLQSAEMSITKMMVLIAVIYTLCVIPEVIVTFLTFLLEGFKNYGTRHNLFMFFYVVVYTFNSINSSANFLVYVTLSSKFKATLATLIPCLSRLAMLRSERFKGQSGSGTGSSSATAVGGTSKTTTAVTTHSNLSRMNNTN